MKNLNHFNMPLMTSMNSSLEIFTAIYYTLAMRLSFNERSSHEQARKNAHCTLWQAGRPCARSFWHHFGPEQSEGEACVQAHLDYYKSTGIDFIKIMSDGLGYPLDVTINCAADWRKVKPLPKDHPFFTESVKRCKEINRALKDETVTFYNVFSPFNVVRERDVFTEEAATGTFREPR